MEPVQHTPLSYTNWYAGQPDNAGGFEDCMEINYKTPGKWNDSPCTEKRKYVCQPPLPPSQQNTHSAALFLTHKAVGWDRGWGCSRGSRLGDPSAVDCG